MSHHHHHEEHHHHHEERPYWEESHHHHHHHEERPYWEEQYCGEGFEGERLYAPPPRGAYERVDSRFYEQSTGPRHHNGGSYQRNERLGELGSLAAGAFSLYEANKAKMDPLYATKHKHEAEAGALGALGSASYAYHEHRDKNKFEDGRW